MGTLFKILDVSCVSSKTVVLFSCDHTHHVFSEDSINEISVICLIVCSYKTRKLNWEVKIT